MGKRNSFMNNGPLAIPRDNVIKFDISTESLHLLNSELKTSNKDFNENLDDKANEIMKELPSGFKRQDAADETL